MIWSPPARNQERASGQQGARLDRRALLHSGGCAAALWAAAFPAGPAFAQQWVDVNDDSGAPIPNLRVPAELDPFQLPGVLWFGAQAPEVTLFDFSDYNCPVCRQAVPHLDALVRGTPGLRLGIVHNPILSAKSREAARAVLMTLRIGGPERAYALHRRLFALRGTVDGARAMAQAKEIGVDVETPAADIARQVDEALAAQEKIAGGIGFSVTPSYVLNGIALFGHPGPASLGRMIAAVKECDALACG